jgi:type I restriction enzyme, S subunit
VQEAKEAGRRELGLERERKAALMQHLFTYGTRGEARKQTEIGVMPETWRAIRLGEVLTQTQYGLSILGNRDGAYPILRMNCLEDGKVTISGLQYVDLDGKTYEKFRLNKGDLLFNRTNSYELVGKTSLFDIDGDFVFASYLLRLATNPGQVIPAYINFYLNWGRVQQRLKAIATRGVAEQAIVGATALAVCAGQHSPSVVGELGVLASCDVVAGAEVWKVGGRHARLTRSAAGVTAHHSMYCVIAITSGLLFLADNL